MDTDDDDGFLVGKTVTGGERAVLVAESYSYMYESRIIEWTLMRRDFSGREHGGERATAYILSVGRQVHNRTGAGGSGVSR